MPLAQNIANLILDVNKGVGALGLRAERAELCIAGKSFHSARVRHDDEIVLILPKGVGSFWCQPAYYSKWGISYPDHLANWVHTFAEKSCRGGGADDANLARSADIRIREVASAAETPRANINVIIAYPPDRDWCV